MRNRLADEQGMTVIELVVAATLSLVIFGATLMVFEAAQRNRARVEEHNDRQQEARVAIDRMARDLRNLASPTDFAQGVGTAPFGVDRNGKYDMVYKTVDGATGATAGNRAAVKRVRYCLDSSDPANGRLIAQQQTSATYTETPPADTACPGAGWTGTPRVIAQHVTNRLGGRDDRPLFAYSADGIQLPYDTPGVLTSTTRVATRLWLDARPGDTATETELGSSVILRNQNRPPEARFEAAKAGFVITLNGSASEDPEQEPLDYVWLEGATPASAVPVEGGVGMIHTLPARPPGTYRFILKVVDSAETADYSDPVEVTLQ